MPPAPSPTNPKLQKRLIGGLSAACLLAAVVMQFAFPAQDAIQGSLIRIGIVLGALAWAMPQPGERFRWQGLVPLIIVFAVLMVATKKLILFLLPALIVVGIALKLTRPAKRGEVLRRPRD